MASTFSVSTPISSPASQSFSMVWVDTKTLCSFPLPMPVRPSCSRGANGTAVRLFLRSAGVTVVEEDRPDRANRRRKGKSDPVDGEAAARAVLAAQAGSQGSGECRMLEW